MNRLDRRVSTLHAVRNYPRVALVMKGIHVVADAASEGGLGPSRHKLIRP